MQQSRVPVVFCCLESLKMQQSRDLARSGPGRLEVAFPTRAKRVSLLNKNVAQEGTVFEACQNSDSGRLAGLLIPPRICCLGI